MNLPTMNQKNFLPQVKAQYEDLPYPPCDPQDEHKRLQRTGAPSALADLPT